MSFDLTSGEVRVGILTPDGVYSYSNTSSDFTAYSFSTNSELRLCGTGNVSTGGTAGCSYSNLKVAYDFIEDANVLARMDKSKALNF